MPQGKGTYGSKVGRPPSKKKSVKRDARKIKAIVRKKGKIAKMKTQLKTPSRTSGIRGVKDYNPSSNKKRIVRKTKAIARKTGKLSAAGKMKLKKY